MGGYASRPSGHYASYGGYPDARRRAWIRPANHRRGREEAYPVLVPLPPGMGPNPYHGHAPPPGYGRPDPRFVSSQGGRSHGGRSHAGSSHGHSREASSAGRHSHLHTPSLGSHGSRSGNPTPLARGSQRSGHISSRGGRFNPEAEMRRAPSRHSHYSRRDWGTRTTSPW